MVPVALRGDVLHFLAVVVEVLGAGRGESARVGRVQSRSVALALAAWTRVLNLLER